VGSDARGEVTVVRSDRPSRPKMTGSHLFGSEGLYLPARHVRCLAGIKVEVEVEVEAGIKAVFHVRVFANGRAAIGLTF